MAEDKINLAEIGINPTDEQLIEIRDALRAGMRAFDLLIEIHEKLGYLPTWTRTSGEIADWYRRATEFLGDDGIHDPVLRRIRGLEPQ